MKSNKILSALLSLSITASAINMLPANAAEIVNSGQCGENAEWTLDSEGTLTISGSGAVTDWGLNLCRFEEDKIIISWKASQYGEICPWYYDRELIKNVVIEEGITHIGTASFIDCDNLISVSLPDTLKTTEWAAFLHCDNLPSIKFPASMEVMDYGFLGFCNSIESLTVPAGVLAIESEAFQRMAGLKSIYILSRDCEISPYAKTISNVYSDGEYRFYGTIYGYRDSTAQAYAEAIGYNFTALETIARGDVDSDGSINAVDASMILSEYARTATGKSSSFEDLQRIISDVNYDNAVDSSDASSVLGYYAYTATGGTDSLEDFLNRD